MYYLNYYPVINVLKGESSTRTFHSTVLLLSSWAFRGAVLVKNNLLKDLLYNPAETLTFPMFWGINYEHLLMDFEGIGLLSIY